jgi:hypothetical protein
MEFSDPFISLVRCSHRPVIKGRAVRDTPLTQREEILKLMRFLRCCCLPLAALFLFPGCGDPSEPSPSPQKSKVVQPSSSDDSNQALDSRPPETEFVERDVRHAPVLDAFKNESVGGTDSPMPPPPVEAGEQPDVIPDFETKGDDEGNLDDDQIASPLPEIEETWQRLSPNQELWIDVENKIVIVGGRITLRAGLLEMFACPRNSKEHESVIATNARPELVHAALLALDIEPGSPAKFDPEFEPARGPELEIMVRFLREGNLEEVRSQEMIRYVRNKKPFEYPWIFAGSEFVDDWNSDRKLYAANYGSFVCVSNFPDAMIDIPAQSSQDLANLLFEANTDLIPPLGTRVLLLLSTRKKALEE